MKNSIWCILKKELKEMFRDKKSLSMMLIIPCMIPLLVFGMSILFESTVNKPIEEYNKIGIAYETNEVEKQIIKEVGIDPVYDTLENLEEKYTKDEIDLYITKKDNTYTIHGVNNDTTTYASTLVESYISAYKDYLQNNYLQNHNIKPTEVTNIITLEENIVEEENYYANYITVYAFLFIIMAITVSATYPATDTTAGEKERGTLETLLTFPIRSRDIIIGKFLSVSISSIITGIISLLFAIVSLLLVKNMFSIYEGIDTMLSFTSILFATIVILAYSFFISGLCIAIASRSKTFKEAQSALTPLTFIAFFPGMIAFMSDMSASPFLSIVPFLNFTVIFTDINSGNINILNLVLMSISTIVYIGMILTYIIKQYKSEKILFSN